MSTAPTMSRKSAFRAALALAEMTQEQWAESVAGVSPGHLSHVLDGRRESGRLIDEIDQFIAKHITHYAPPAVQTT